MKLGNVKTEGDKRVSADLGVLGSSPAASLRCHDFMRKKVEGLEQEPPPEGWKEITKKAEKGKGGWTERGCPAGRSTIHPCPCSTATAEEISHTLNPEAKIHLTTSWEEKGGKKKTKRTDKEEKGGFLPQSPKVKMGELPFRTQYR